MRSFIILIWVVLEVFCDLRSQSLHSFSDVQYLKHTSHASVVEWEPLNTRPFLSAGAIPFDIKKQLDSVIISNPSKQKLENLICYSYSNDLLVQAQYLEWKDANKEWVQIARSLYDFDAPNRLSEETLQKRDGDVWLNFSQINIEYHPDGRPKARYSYDWDKANQKWLPAAKDTQVYDQKNRLKRKDYFLWDHFISSWLKTEAEELEYNAKDQLITKTKLSWDEIFKIYINQSRQEHSYLPSGLPVTQLFLEWDQQIGDWLPAKRESRVYNIKLRPTTLLRERWGFNGWANEQKTETTYDIADNAIQYLSSNWDDRLNRWTSSLRVENQHNNAYSFENLLLPPISDFYTDPNGNFYHQLISTNQFTFSGNNATNDKLIQYHYSDVLPVSSDQFESFSPVLFPNPVSDRIFIKLSEQEILKRFSLYNMQGKELLRNNQITSEGIPVEHLPSGSYYFIIQSQRRSGAGKLIIR